MTKGLPRGRARGSELANPIRKLTIPVQAFALSIVGATGVGFGSAVLAGMPEGNFMLLGAVASIQFSGSGSDPNLIATWLGDYGIGTTPASDATITGDDVNIVPSTALAAATAEVSPITRGVQADGAFCGVVLDNTAADLEFNLNLLIDDTSISGTVPITAEGVVIVSYIMLGDD